MTVNVRTYLTLSPYASNPAPGQQDTTFGRYMVNELRRVQTTLQSHNEAAPQATAIAPVNPRIGTIRYATGAWATTLGAEGLYVYKSSGWTRIV